jgi:hypothetical protein
MKLPSGSRTIEMRAVVPSVVGASASRPPLRGTELPPHLDTLRGARREVVEPHAVRDLHQHFTRARLGPKHLAEDKVLRVPVNR